MRRYDIVFGILLILSIIDFALAAPVLVREKLQAHVDVAQIPKDAITVFGKRGNEELERLLAEFFDATGKSVDSQDAHTPSSSAPPGPDHGSMDNVKAPAPNLASPPAHPDPLTEPLNPSPIPYSMPVVQGDPLSESESDYEWLFDSNGEPLVPLPSPTSTEFGSDHETNWERVPKPNPNSNPGPSTQAGPDPDFDWDHWMDLEDLPPPKWPKIASEEVGQVHENQVDNMPLSNPPWRDMDFDWNHWMTLEDQPPLKRPKLASSKELGQAYWHEDQVVQVQQQPNPGTTNPGLPTEPGHGVVTAPSPNTGSPKELDDDEDAQAAAIYAAKGKAKETRRRASIPGTARDVVNAVQTRGRL